MPKKYNPDDLIGRQVYDEYWDNNDEVNKRIPAVIRLSYNLFQPAKDGTPAKGLFDVTKAQVDGIEERRDKSSLRQFLSLSLNSINDEEVKKWAAMSTQELVSTYVLMPNDPTIEPGRSHRQWSK